MSLQRRVLDVFSRLVEAASLALILLLLIRFGLQFQHPAKWDALAPVVMLKRYGDPILVLVGDWTGLTWSPAARGWLPLILAVAVRVVNSLIGGAIDWLEELQRGAPPPLKPAVAPPPALPADPMSTQLAPGGYPAPAPNAAPAPAAMHTTIGRYQVVERIGQGAMGVVYKAQDPQIGRTVAIKCVRAMDIADPAVEQYRKRFLIEAQSAGQLNHRGIVAVYDVIADQHGQPCLVMEFVEGTTLERYATEGESLTISEAMDLIVEACFALGHAHKHGIVHRDIKPANLMVTREAHVKVSDFGIAKMAGSSLTVTGQIIGTPGFMSPEQFTGAPVDARSDIFSLGAVLYWLCTSQRPFPGDTLTAIAYNVVNNPPTPPRHANPAVPDQLERVILRCLEKDANARYPDMQSLAADLTAIKASSLGEMTLPLKA